ncbi:MAG: hypothetical protein QXG25_00760 [Nitrososphaerota archaeon]
MDEVIHALIMALRAEGQIKTLMKPVIPKLDAPIEECTKFDASEGPFKCSSSTPHS